MMKLTLTPDVRFVDDKLTNCKASVTLGDAKFAGTFKVMPASASTQVAITAVTEKALEADVVVSEADLADVAKNVVELKGNATKLVSFKKGQSEVDTGIVLSDEEKADVASKFVTSDTTLKLAALDHGDAPATLQISRSGNDAAEVKEVEFVDMVLATGSLTGVTMGLVIKGGSATDPIPVRIDALCNWSAVGGVKKNREHFKMVTKDHDAAVVTLAVDPKSPSKPTA